MEGSATVEGVSTDTLATFLSGQNCGHNNDNDDNSGVAGPTLVVDCRPFMAYNTGHILGAVNVHCPPILKRRSGGFVALENIVVDEEKRGRLQRGGYGRVVVYDQSTADHLPSSSSEADRDSNLCSVLRSLRQQVSLDQVFYLLGGYDAFSQDCPLLCVTQQFTPLSLGRPETAALQTQTTVDDDQPVEILPHLYLGSGAHSSRREMLERLGVTALLNVSASCPDHFPSAFRYLRVPVRDSVSADLASWFARANQFIDEVQAEGGRVLVHCQAGRSRSATVCLAYLMRTLHLSLDAAFEHVRSRRRVIDPNLNFMRQLEDYRCRLDAEQAASGTPGFVFPPSGSSSTSSSSSSSSPCAIPSSLLPRAPAEAPAPITLPSASRPSSIPPAYSAADLPPPSPATASDVHCFFSFSPTHFSFPSSSTAFSFPSSSTAFSFPSSSTTDFSSFPGSGSLARTPEIPLPS
ncbi:dual specificity protein phosphatase 1-like [Babylonia areolata]|uniref:dual specificity protein phosphatase 1-like n=1 Tax=Babylonia areolata TaxID=304850 RepID=UPI003FD2E9CF